MGLGLNGLKEELLGENGGSKSEEAAIREFVQFLIQGNGKINQHIAGEYFIQYQRSTCSAEGSPLFFFFFPFISWVNNRERLYIQKIVICTKKELYTFRSRLLGYVG